MPQRGRPPGAHLGRQYGRRGGPWVDGAPRIEEINSDMGDQFGLENRPYTKQVAGLRVGGDGPRRSIMEHEGHDNALGLVDGADYDIYEDSDSTVAYAVELAMKDNEEWLVEKALERIRRAHSEGHKNVTLSKRELEALERKRLQAGPGSLTDNKRFSGGNGATWRGGGDATSVANPPPYPLDTSIYGAWARTTSASVSPQTSTTTLRSPLQPPFAGSMTRPPAFFAPPALPRPYPDDHQWTAPQKASPSREPRQSLRSPIDPPRGSPTRVGQRPYLNVPPQASFVTPDPAATAPEPVVNKDSESDYSSPKKRSPAISGDDIPIVEVIEHKVPSSPTRVAGKGSRPRSNQP